MRRLRSTRRHLSRSPGREGPIGRTGLPRLPADSPATRDACVSLGSKWPRGRGRRLGQGCDNMDSFPPRSLTWLCFLLPCFSGQPEIPRLSARERLPCSLLCRRPARPPWDDPSRRPGVTRSPPEFPLSLRPVHRGSGASHVLYTDGDRTGPCWAAWELLLFRVPPQAEAAPYKGV